VGPRRWPDEVEVRGKKVAGSKVAAGVRQSPAA